MLFTGQQVVCTQPKPWTTVMVNGEIQVVPGPKLDEICTIAGFCLIAGVEGLHLKGYSPDLKLSDGTTPGYSARWFKPLSKKSTEIGMGVLREIARTGKMPSKKKADA